MQEESKIQLRIGDIVLADIVAITKEYVLMSMGDVQAVMPSSEYSWHRHDKVKSCLKVGSSIKVVVIAIKDQIPMLSVKRMTADPWKSVNDNYKVGMQVKGRVKHLSDYGIFILLDDGVQGLMHKKNIINTDKVDLKSLFSKDQEIQVYIEFIEAERQRIGLSMIEVK